MHFLLLLFVALGSTSYVQDVPLFVWSGDESYIASRNEQIRGYYTTESVGALLQGFWKDGEKNNGLLHMVKPDQQLELVVLLVNSALSSEEFSLHHTCVPTLAETMSSHPSFYVPYVSATTESSITHAARKSCHKAQKSGATAYYLGPDSFLSHLERHAPLTSIKAISEIAPAFVNGKADILVVYLDDEKKMMSVEQTVQDLMNAFHTAGFTRYVVALTSVESSLEHSLPSNAEMGIAEQVKRAILQTPPANNGTYPPTIYNGRNTFNVYFNGVFWELFVVVLVFWTVVGCGLKQLLQVQAPDRIPNLNAHKKKK